MARFAPGKKPRKYSDLSTVESQRNDLTAEEFPEGPYGSGLPAFTLGKDGDWRPEQNPPNPYSYENVALHEGISRAYPAEDAQIEETKEEETS